MGKRHPLPTSVYDSVFVIKKQNEVAYIQVAETVKNPETLERELHPFRKLKDKYPCFLITLDNDFNKDYEGIKSVNAIDFLCGKRLR